MTEPFDWADMSHEAASIRYMYGNPAAAAYLRTRIEAAFVPGPSFYAVVTEYGEVKRALSARAEAAEARVSELTTQLAEARQAERAAVVAWLRESITQGAKMPGALARHIEAGEHLA